jgi:hypothetical protein
MALERGQVIALRRNAPALIFLLTTTHAWVVPIGGYNGPPPHRAEVRFDDPGEIFSCGVSFRFPVVRCHQAFQVTLAVANAAAVLGAASAALISRVQVALRREAETRALETRLHHHDRGGVPVLLIA